MKKLLIPLFTLAVLLASGCGHKKDASQEESSPEIKEMIVTAQDSTEVYGLIRQFMDAAKDHEFDKAVAMLHTADAEDPYEEPWPLTEDEKSDVLTALRLMPIQKYSIEDLNFESPYNTQARIKIWIDDEMSTYYYLNFVRYLGQWKTCVKNEVKSPEEIAYPSDL